MTGSEVETALVIAAPAPLRLAGEIAALTAIAGYTLIADPARQIRDVYLDTRDRALAARQVAVRVRTIDGVDWLTFKGPSRQTVGEARERVEVEQRWSPEAVSGIVELLGAVGIRLGATALPDADPLVPESVLGALGLRSVQRRETHRQPRWVVPAGDTPGVAVAELAIDAVTYRLARRGVRLCAIEVEVRLPDGAPASEVVTRDLLARYAPAIRLWPHAKLATGMAIEDLLNEGALDRALAPDGTLQGPAFDLVEARLVRTASDGAPPVADS